MSVPASFRRAVRALREHAYLSAVSVGVITAALVLLGMYALLVVNVQAIVGGWKQDVHVSAYFSPGVDPEKHAALLQQVAARPEVQAAILITEAEAQAWMAERMPEVRPILAELGPEALPASLEITLRSGHQSPEAMDAFVETLNASQAFSEVDYGREWVDRANHFLKTMRMLGFTLGIVLALAALFLVGNTINLVVYARRDELEIMRLVGATDAYILAPFLIEGLILSTSALVLAFAGLQVLHQGVLSQLSDLLPLAYDQGGFAFLPGELILLMVLCGWFIGVAPAWVAVRRFLAALP